MISSCLCPLSFIFSRFCFLFTGSLNFPLRKESFTKEDGKETLFGFSKFRLWLLFYRPKKIHYNEYGSNKRNIVKCLLYLITPKPNRTLLHTTRFCPNRTFLHTTRICLQRLIHQGSTSVCTLFIIEFVAKLTRFIVFNILPGLVCLPVCPSPPVKHLLLTTSRQSHISLTPLSLRLNLNSEGRFSVRSIWLGERLVKHSVKSS